MEQFWSGKKVLVSGHTGFKGSWLCLWLSNLGADVIGYSLEPPTNPSLFRLADLDRSMISIIADVSDKERLDAVFNKYKPELVFHLAAQSLVRESYKSYVNTFETNIMGTVNILNSALNTDSVKAVINVTSDKCYENKEWLWGYRENDSMGGFDPYSCSKGCSELITNSFRQSFYNSKGKFLASVRAGNVIGGGDWAEDRIVPDIIKALSQKSAPIIRNPHSIRPWQHVLEPLRGYMLLAEKLYKEGAPYAEAWNFGGDDRHIVDVSQLTNKIMWLWGSKEKYKHIENNRNREHESQILKLDCSKAKSNLGWSLKLSIEETLEWTVDWYKAYYCNSDMREISLYQIERYGKLGENADEI